MVNRKTASALTIAALLACAIPTRAASFTGVSAAQVIAQTPSFSLPDSVPKGTTVRVSSSSDNMNSISEALGNGFESQYSGEVEVTTKDADAALQDVLNDNADVAAISRPLTAEEEEKGLIANPVRREKIAIVVGKDNTFAQSITGSQFAQIFRGEIKDWSEVGGTAGPIRMVDRPDASETRQALKPYPVFTTAEFETGDTATQLTEDSTEALARELGTDGIGYALVSQLEGQSDIKAIELHKTLPSDPRYPFSQPYSFVYAGGASPAVAAFLGYATSQPGQAAIESAGLSGNGILPTTATADGTTPEGATGGTNEATGAPSPDTAIENSEAGATPNGIGTLNAEGQLVDASGNLISPEGYLVDTNGNFVDANGTLLAEGVAPVLGVGVVEGIGSAVDGVADGAGNLAGEAANGVGDLAAGRGRWWWLLLPLAGLGLLIWVAGKRGTEEEAGYSASAAGRTDDRTLNSFRSGNTPAGNTPGVGLGSTTLGSVEADSMAASTGQVGRAGLGKAGLGKAVAGGSALAGGAAAGAGLAGRMKGGAGDVTMDLDGVSSAVGGVDSVKGSAQGGLGNLRSNVQGGIDSNRSNIQGGIDGARNSVQGGIDSANGIAQGRLDSTRGKFQEGIDGIKGKIPGSDQAASDGNGNWLDRAKQRINEATDQAKNKATDTRDDIHED